MKTWFITGANRGIGLGIARAALEAGEQVVATARRPEQAEVALAGLTGDRLLTVRLDVVDSTSIQSAVDAAVAHFGRIDILVNNAGYGQLGVFEQQSVTAIHRQFGTNVFGTMEVTRAMLPLMRKQRSGHIFTVSSIGGLVGAEGGSIYCATKFALEGWSEAVSFELKQFGIKTTLIEPGFFRTDFLDASSASYGDIIVPDYADYSAKFRAQLDAMNHKQAGDPDKLGKVIVSLAASNDPPLRFAAGSDAYRVISDRAPRDHAEADRWRELSVSTDIAE